MSTVEHCGGGLARQPSGGGGGRGRGGSGFLARAAAMELAGMMRPLLPVASAPETSNATLIAHNECRTAAAWTVMGCLLPLLRFWLVKGRGRDQHGAGCRPDAACTCMSGCCPDAPAKVDNVTHFSKTQM